MVGTFSAAAAAATSSRNVSSYRSLAQLCLCKVEHIVKQWWQHIPYIHPHYAVKSYPNPILINKLAQSGFGFDCASKNEICLTQTCTKLASCHPISLIYANPTKSPDDIEYAMKHNVNDYVVDSIEEVEKIHGIDPAARYVIRMLSHESDSIMKFNKKFGANFSECHAMMDYMAKHDLHFSGFSYHVGSKCRNMDMHKHTIDGILSHCVPYGEANGLKTSVIDIGGGFECVQNLADIHRLCSDNYLTLFERKGIQLMAEPGRLISSGSLNLITKVIAVRERRIGEESKLYITINDSVYHSFQGKMFDYQLFQPKPLYNACKNARSCTIFGQTCDSLDVICENVMLPPPAIGDFLLFENMGAYSLASATGQFNGFESAIMLDAPLS